VAIDELRHRAQNVILQRGGRVECLYRNKIPVFDCKTVTQGSKERAHNCTCPAARVDAYGAIAKAKSEPRSYDCNTCNAHARKRKRGIKNQLIARASILDRTQQGQSCTILSQLVTEGRGSFFLGHPVSMYVYIYIYM
jgi:hypothetical protein